MKGLVIKNPWLWCTTRAAVDGEAKTVENRGWTTAYRGDVALIEGRRLDNAAWDGSLAPLIRACRERWWEAQPDGWKFGPWPWETARGAVVAVAELHDVCDRSGVGAGGCHCRPWAVRGEYHWRWADIRLLPEPVPMVGWQGLRDLPADVDAAVREQLAVPA